MAVSVTVHVFGITAQRLTMQHLPSGRHRLCDAETPLLPFRTNDFSIRPSWLVKIGTPSITTVTSGLRMKSSFTCYAHSIREADDSRRDHNHQLTKAGVIVV